MAWGDQERELEILPIDVGPSRPPAESPSGPGSKPVGGSLVGHRSRQVAVIIVLGFIGVWVLLAVVGWVLDAGTDETEEVLLDDPSSAISAVVEPHLGLVDGESVRLTAAPFDPDRNVSALMCTAVPIDELDSLTDECDTGTYRIFKSNADGNLDDAPYVVARSLTIAGRRVDCARLACVVRVSQLDNPSHRRDVTLQFDPDNASLLPPVIDVNPAEGLVDAQTVILTGKRFAPATSVTASQCIIGRPEAVRNCERPTVTTLGNSNHAGALRMAIEVQRFMFIQATWVDCANLEAGRCAIVVDEGAPGRTATAVPLSFTAGSRAAARVAVSPDTGLVDGDQTTITAATSLFQDGDPALRLCAAENPAACTNLVLSSVFTDGADAWLVTQVPRRFTTERGTRHDCVEDGPCVIGISVFQGEAELITRPVSFDPEAPLRPVIAPVVTPNGPYIPDQEVEIAAADRGTKLNVSICAVDERDYCEVLTTRVDSGNPATGSIATVNLHRLIITPEGPWDCLLDGPCELISWNRDDEQRLAAVSLEFDPAVKLGDAVVVDARPTQALVDGSVVEVRVAGATPQWYRVSLCVVATEVCAGLEELEASSAVSRVSRVHLPRLLYAAAPSEITATTHDCALTSCEIRITGARFVERIPVHFRAAPRPDLPELAISANSKSAIGSTVTLKGRSFLPLGVGGDTTVKVAFCATPEFGPFAGGCTSLLGESPLLDERGRFNFTFTVSSLEVINLFRSDQPICVTQCWIVASVGQGHRQAALAVEFYYEN